MSNSDKQKTDRNFCRGWNKSFRLISVLVVLQARVINYKRGAVAVGLDGISEGAEKPLPKGMVWNMVYDPDADGMLETITSNQLWHRLEVFLNAVIPTAEKYGLILAVIPTIPLPWFDNTRLVYWHHWYKKQSI